MAWGFCVIKLSMTSWMEDPQRSCRNSMQDRVKLVAHQLPLNYSRHYYNCLWDSLNWYTGSLKGSSRPDQVPRRLFLRSWDVSKLSKAFSAELKRETREKERKRKKKKRTCRAFTCTHTLFMRLSGKLDLKADNFWPYFLDYFEQMHTSRSKEIKVT